MDNIQQSNSRLADAAKSNPDTRPRVKQAQVNAQQVSGPKSQDNFNVGSRDEQVKQQEQRSQTKVNKPSFEGYMNSSTAHIQVSKAGYDNPKHQQARNRIASTKGKTPSVGKVSSMSFASSTSKRGTIDNYSKLSFSNNTKSSMDKMLKNDNYFR